MLRLTALVVLATSAAAFQPLSLGKGATKPHYLSATETPYFVNLQEVNSDLVENVIADEPAIPHKSGSEVLPPKRKITPKKADAVHKKGILSPAVYFAKEVMGDKELNQFRAKVISKHTKVIGALVDTSDSVFGTAVLMALFKVADKDGNGTICKEELQAARESLGFSWLKDKQINGIFERADSDGNGEIDMEEWIAAAPKTLRTNLTKLAKKNGAELGFLV